MSNNKNIKQRSPKLSSRVTTQITEEFQERLIKTATKIGVHVSDLVRAGIVLILEELEGRAKRIDLEKFKNHVIKKKINE